MALSVTISGNQAIVKADDYSFAGAMSGEQATITTATKQATVSFTDPQAIVQWTGGRIGNVCSSYLSDAGYLIDPFVLPYAAGFTLGDATELITYIGYDLLTNTILFRDRVS